MNEYINVALTPTELDNIKENYIMKTDNSHIIYCQLLVFVYQFNYMTNM